MTEGKPVDAKEYNAKSYAEAEKTLNELCRLAYRHDAETCIIGNVTALDITRMVNALSYRRHKIKNHFENELEQHLIVASVGEANCGACGDCLLAGPCSDACPRIVMRELLDLPNRP